MSTDDKMTIDERRKYLRRMKKRYVQADRKEQGRLLDEMETVTNPRQLRRGIYDLIDHLFSLPGAVPGRTEDVYQTLAQPLNLGKGADRLGSIIF